MLQNSYVLEEKNSKMKYIQIPLLFGLVYQLCWAEGRRFQLQFQAFRVWDKKTA